jgi:proline racemase
LVFADRVRSALAAAGITGFDPQTGMQQPIDHIEVCSERAVPDGVGALTMTLCPGMSYDRSPCGTGTSAKLATLHARGKLAVGEALHNRSIAGTDFVGTVLDAVERDGRATVLPQVRGSAYITGFQRFVFDAADPLAYGMRADG